MKLLAPALLVLLGTVLAVRAAEEGLFHSDPNHAWNRLHSHLHTRTTREGKRYNQEGLEPLFFRRSRFLTNGAAHKQALALLDRFLENHEERLIDDPLKRAILQRDLWAIFNMTADAELDRQPERRQLQKRLALVMRRIALSPDEIKKLPDNLALAVQAKTFPQTYDPSDPDRPFLPSDLLKADGPWVMLGDRWGWKGDFLAAPVHAKALGGRSVVLIFLRLPGGGEKAEAYLKTLESVRIGTDEIPQIPAGTQVALLRRMLLFDKNGTIRPTPITESLQIRVYQDLKAPDSFEFTLGRKELFESRMGLDAVGPEEINYFDVGLVRESARDPFENSTPGRGPSPVVLKSCITCHAGPGIWGFRSMFVEQYDHPAMCVPDDLNDQLEEAIEEAQKTYAWGLLQGLWEAAESP